MNPYAILGCTMQSADTEIRDAYLERVRAFPPDSSAAKFQLIREAYERIGAEEGRAREVRSVVDPMESLDDAVGAYCGVAKVMMRPPKVEALRRGIIKSLGG